MPNYDDIVNRYMERTGKSREAHAEAKLFLPRGVSSNFRAVEPNPIFIESAIGTTITDADGNRYIDFAMAFGAMLVGHAHPKVAQAIEVQAKKGTLHAMPHRLEMSVAKELRRRVGQEQWRFSNSGTEATMHAIRLARGFTGRSKVIKFEGAYHGAHDTVLVSNKPPLRLAGMSVKSAAGLKQTIQAGTGHPRMPGYGREYGGPLTDAQVASLVDLILRNFPTR